jgi:hypothetical protein
MSHKKAGSGVGCRMMNNEKESIVTRYEESTRRLSCSHIEEGRRGRLAATYHATSIKRTSLLLFDEKSNISLGKRCALTGT